MNGILIYDQVDQYWDLKKFHRIMEPKHVLEKAKVQVTKTNIPAWPTKYWCARLMGKTDMILLR